MKRKHEDRLARLAFGDVSPAETFELEQLAAQDPEIARTLNEYRSIREGLRELADVPAHQLSNERLKEAILGQGLRAKPHSTLDLSWLWMSGVACAAVAFLFVGLSRHRAVEPQVLIDPGKMEMNGDVALNKSFDHPFEHVAVPSVRVDRSATKTVALNKGSLTAHRSRHHRASGGYFEAELITGILSDPMEDATAVPVPTASGPMPDTSTDVGSEATAKLQPVDDKPDGGVVVIESDKDPNTGTQKATELGSTTNVVFGG